MTIEIFLIGPMGSGKSTIGKVLAKQLGLEYIDSDREIEHRTGANIPWIFDVEGEAGFRQREALVIDELTQKPNIVLATGGGSILREDNRTRLKSRGYAVYLQTSINQQFERTLKDRNRPLLQTENPRETLEKLMLEREPLYLETAEIVVKTDRYRPNTVVQEIIDRLGLAKD